MNYGLYLSAGGALTGIHRLDVAANNLANVNTTGFKTDFAAVMQRDPERIESGALNLPSNRLLERLGGGVLSAPTRTDFAPAAPIETRNPLDVALLGEGFFVVDSGGGAGDARLRFTRDGRFALNADGALVTASGGLAVLDDAGDAITLEPAQPATIDDRGQIHQGGQVVAQLGVTAPADPDALRKLGDNLYGFAPGRSATRRAVEARLKSGAIESSGVDPIRGMLAVTNASGAVQSNTRMIQIQDEMMARAINTFGRIS